MSNRLHLNLAWLPGKPADFTERCQAFPSLQNGFGEALRQLANHALGAYDLMRLAKLAERARRDGRSLAPLVPVRLGVTSNATTSFMVPVLIGTALRHGIDLEVIEADFDQVRQEALSPDSRLNKAAPDIVLVAVDHHGLALSPPLGDAEAAQAAVDAVLADFNAIRAGFRRGCNAPSILQTIARPAEPLFGSLDFGLPGTSRRLVESVNRGMADQLAGSSDLLFDVASLAETIGLAEWHDPSQWNLAKIPFASHCLPLYADHLCRLLGAVRGKSRRCLILDLDDTVWGGVIGDDGLDGIILGQGDAAGEAHLEIQRTALALRARGIVLAVSSKNDDEIARLPFRQHPEMLLKENHIAVFQANWNDKTANIRAIAAELGVGLDAMVFLDNSAVERDQVRQQLPMVAVPELPEDPALYAATLSAAGYFESIAYSTEDRARADFYQDKARRVALEATAGDLDSYLASLDMEVEFRPFDAVGRTRITQLINKSNQFNLTTRRYTEAEIQAAEEAPDVFTLQVRLRDKFGDNGMIAVVICRSHDTAWDIDSWLMSCRALNRKIEAATLMELVRAAREHGIERLTGLYRPTDRNELVRDHYARLGFVEVGTAPDGAKEWVLEVDAAPQLDLPMKIVR